MTTEEFSELKKLISLAISELEDSDIYLEKATQIIKPGCSRDSVSRIGDIGDKSVNEARQVNVKLRLEKLKNALIRMEDRNYGICIRCDKEIPFGRLRAVPETLICVPCAEKNS